MILFSTVLFDPPEEVHSFSNMYDETWVEKLYRGVKRNMTKPFHFICHTDRPRTFSEKGIHTCLLSRPPFGYHSCIEPYRFGFPMILVGLDTIITDNIDHLADYCLTRHQLAVPLDPFNPAQVCNGVALVPKGFESVYADHRGENDMEWIRRYNPAVIDTLFPDQVLSYKCHIKPRGGIGGARIVYFHGEEKPHQLSHLSWVTENWR